MLSCVVDAKNHAGEKLFDFKDSDLKISGSLFDIGSNAKTFSAVASSGNRNLEITDTRINVIYGNVFALSTSDFGTLSVNRNKLSVSGVQNSFIAFRGKTGTLDFSNNKFQTDSTVWLSTILEITGGTARIESNQILMADQLGFLGFNLSSCDFTVRKNSLVSRTKGFAYFIKTAQGKGLIDNNSLFIEKARDFSAVLGTSNSLSILNNYINSTDITASVIYLDLENSLNTMIAGNFFDNPGKSKEAYLIKADSFSGFDLISNYTYGNMIWFFQQKKNVKIRTARDLNGNAAFIGLGEVKGNSDVTTPLGTKDGLLSSSNKNNANLYPVLQDADLQALAQQKTGVPLKKAAGPYDEGQ
jgi:hypothetical protein